MYFLRALLLPLLILVGCQLASAEETNLKPKFGLVQKNDAQKAADKEFIEKVDEQWKGDRKKAAEYLSSRGWQYLRQGNKADAMRRFNQAWLLDNTNGGALWGMGAIQGSTGKFSESLKLLSEAERTVGDDIDFSVDYAMTKAMVAGETDNVALLQEAFSSFERIHQKAPLHTINLQNWSITLFNVGNYAEAWKKLKLAEATPRHAELNKSFIAALQEKMPRP